MIMAQVPAQKKRLAGAERPFLHLLRGGLCSRLSLDSIPVVQRSQTQMEGWRFHRAAIQLKHLPGNGRGAFSPKPNSRCLQGSLCSDRAAAGP